MKLNYFLKKIENLIIKKSFNYPKTIIDYFNNNKKTTVLSFSSIGRGRRYIQQNEFFYLTKKYNVFTLMKWTFLFGLILSTPLTISEFNSVEWNSLPWFAIWRMTYVVVGTTFFTYLFNTYALKTLSATTVGSFIYLQPIITIIFALATGNDSLDFTKVFACLLVFLGVYMVSKKN